MYYRYIIFLMLSLFLIKSSCANETKLSLNVSVSTKSKQDKLSAVLFYEVKGFHISTLQNKINKLINQSTKRVLQEKDIELSTGDYSSYRKDKENFWIVRQAIMLKTFNSTLLKTLVAELQTMGLALQNFSFYLSEEKKESLIDGLLKEALQKAKSRAEYIAKAIDKTDITFVAIRHGVKSQEYHNREIGFAKAVHYDSNEIIEPSVLPKDEIVTTNVEVDFYIE